MNADPQSFIKNPLTALLAGTTVGILGGYQIGLA